ncbi:MAG: Hpt domain-containing protein [Pseudomonadota bacterium]
MLSKLLEPLVGIVTLLLFVANLVFWCIPFYIVAFFKFIIPIKRWRQFLKPAAAEEPLAAEADHALIDPSVLDAIRSLGESAGEGLMEEVVGLYLSSSEELINELRQAVDASDGQAIQAIAHNLKSGSYNVGATQLGDLFQLIENAGDRNDTPRARSLFAEAEAMRPSVEATLRQLAPKVAA